ncbi:CBF/Mak21 family-domain-containing protein [Kickxella alabastrina]|uniref:CBF/Mak21 family-domain-containing protein n=1 Tax=Kickxella alabastrina TaxID=61397 RepID=UPI00221FEFA5|nr:CBF/Mak21 family-domain-containing protein [Kickxella alabastrina]KAI7826442.1 CBF/Mak21 family-domain-containing protein [Kickxella alabastrina]
MSKRKHSSIKDDKGSATKLTESVRRWEASVLSSQQNLNDIVEIFGVAKGIKDEAAFVAIGSLGRIYTALWAKGLITRHKDRENPASSKVSDWLRDNYNQYTDLLRTMIRNGEAAMQVAALKLSLQMLGKEGQNMTQLSGAYEFPNEGYLATLECVLDNNKASEHLLRTLADSYLNSYDDLRMYFYRDVAKILSPDYDPFKGSRRNGASSSASRASALLEGTEVFVHNAFTVMNMVRVMPKAEVAQLDSMWVSVPEGQKRGVVGADAAADDGGCLQADPHDSAQAHYAAHGGCQEPDGLLSNSYDAGGSVSLLALNGLFTLITDYNLNYPQFYEKLYALFDRNLFHVKYRARFFRLFDIFLGSSHLPAYLVAAFIKRIARLALSAPPSGAVIAIPVVYNLLKAHPRCMALIHRMPGYDDETGEETVIEGEDPYLADEPDLAKCMAIHSSLWEMETLQNHYYPNIATLAKIFSEPFHKPKFMLEDFLDHTYATFFESDSSRKLKKAPALAVQTPTTLLRAGDAIGEFLVL